MSARKSTYTVWVKFEPSEIEGEWTAHCLDFDLVSQGRGVEHTMAMIQEAIGLTLACDLFEGRDSHERRAPEADWKALEDIRRKGRPCTLEQVKRGSKAFVMSSTIEVARKLKNAEVTKAPKVSSRPALAQAYC